MTGRVRGWSFKELEFERMRKFFLSLLCLALLAGTATAGEVKTGEKGAKCITISGEIELDTVARSNSFGDLYRLGHIDPANPYNSSTGLPSYPANQVRAFDIFGGRNQNSEEFSVKVRSYG